MSKRNKSSKLYDAFRCLYEQSRSTILLVDGSGIIECNEAAVKTFGAKSKAELLSIHPSHFSPDLQPNGRKSKDMVAEIERLAWEHDQHRFTWTHRRLSGEEFSAEVTLFPVVFENRPVLVSVINDFEKDPLVQSQLNERALLKTVIDAVPGPVSYISASGHYLYVNRVLCAQLGKDESHFIGKPVGFMKRDDSYPEIIRSFLKSDEQELQCLLPLRTERGERWHIICLRRAGSESTGGLVSIGVDVHDQRRLEIESSRLRQTSEYAARLAAIGEMAAGMAHEINNPLAIIEGKISQAIRLLKKQPQEAERAIAGLEKASATIFRIAKIIKGLQHFSRSAAHDPFATIQLTRVIDAALSLCQERFRTSGVELIFDPASAEVAIECRETQLAQVLLNLINNSFDAVANLTEKWIKIEIAVVNQSDLELRITDSGRGIPASVLKNIMNPFFTTKEIGQGSGLGLSISKGIVDDHGGSLQYDGELANTSFVVHLPLKQGVTKKGNAA